MSADSLLNFLANNTQYYNSQAQAEQDKYDKGTALQNQTRDAQQKADTQGNLALMADANNRMDAIRNEGAVYSESKLREQQRRGIAETGNAYSDARLRDQLGLQPKGVIQEHPLENYLGGVKDQESYRPAMLQYLSNGGRRPKWYTGNYETDAPNINAAISATMTPEQQMKRHEVQIRQQDLEEQRKARNQLYKDKEAEREREAAAKQELGKQKAQSIGREDKLTAHSVLAGVLGPDYATTDKGTLDAMGVRIASRAKSMMNSEEGKGLDLEEAMQSAVDDMVLTGELKMPTEGTWLGRMTGGIVGPNKTPVKFNRNGTEQPQQQTAAAASAAPVAASQVSTSLSLESSEAQDWIARAQANPKNKGFTLEQIIAKGRELGKFK